MKNKLVLWGSNAENERLLIALELRPEDNMINVFTFPETIATEAFSQQMMNDWREDKEVPFPDGYGQEERLLSITDSMLPDNLKVERDDILQRAQTEWHFIVLSSKLNETYHTELDELRDRVERLKRFEDSMWEELKAFWDKVQAQVRDRNLFRDHANDLRDKTNELFSKMKSLRAKLDDEFERSSEEHRDRFLALLADVEERMKKGLRLQPIFDELKKLQREFRETKFTREHRASVWERLDAAFKAVKEKRFGSAGSDDRSPVDRLKRRYDGLMSAIDKMERSIKRDRNDLDFQNRKIARTDGQLEAQLRKAKIMMIEERIRSKEEKLAEMMQTKAELDRRMASLREKEAQRAEQERLEEARRQAQEKIAEEIKQAAASRDDKAGDLEKAAEAINPPAAAETPSTGETSFGDVLRDAVDTARAVAYVVSNSVEAAIEELQQQLQAGETPAGDEDEPESAGVEAVEEPGEKKEE